MEHLFLIIVAIGFPVFLLSLYYYNNEEHHPYYAVQSLRKSYRNFQKIAIHTPELPTNWN